MEIIYSSKALKDLTFWKNSGNKQVQKKIYELIADIIEHPFEGIGKPEPLKHELTGKWSRRINSEHRLVYEILPNDKIVILSILSLKGHY
ncbi:Txe/YoeB family addiction module toxin [Mucilaginibacter sp. OK098]|uniref:Txe/YoeB family addiction module toxin n=1 Tax=Mucilaginibacter sp. OK098 TaxID=1855297 RepID=UPI0009116D00|nr:Txe/YoeB family addiction module toxin [Mucilaginibacter sp. OK098]SHN18089.1 toxin YoeB [Mucilaginibacter sp. OK098]